MKRSRPWNPRRDEAHWDFTAGHIDPRAEPGVLAIWGGWVGPATRAVARHLRAAVAGLAAARITLGRTYRESINA